MYIIIRAKRLFARSANLRWSPAEKVERPTVPKVKTIVNKKASDTVEVNSPGSQKRRNAINSISKKGPRERTANSELHGTPLMEKKDDKLSKQAETQFMSPQKMELIRQG